VDNVLGRSMFKFASGSTARDGLSKMQNALIRGGYDKSYVFRLGPTQVQDLYDYMYGSGEGKDYSAPTPKMEGGPVKLAEGEQAKDPQYEYALKVVTDYTNALPIGLKQLSQLKNMLRDRESVIGFADMIRAQKAEQFKEEERMRYYPEPVPNADGGMADGRPMDAENVGIMDGVGIGAEALMAQEQAIDQAQDIGGLMSAIRGKPINEEEARGELAELVGPEDAQQTPESVLALVQPVMELAKGQGIAQFVEEAEVEEPQAFAQGGPVRLVDGGTAGTLPSGMDTYRGYEIPDLMSAYEGQLPVIQDIMGGPRDPSGLKSDILFQIAAGGLEMARARKPGESANPFSIFAQSFQQPLLNIGALARDERKTAEAEQKQLKATALNLAQSEISNRKSEVDAIIATDLEKQKQEREAQEREEDLLGDTQVFYSVLDKKNVPLSKKAVIELRDTFGEEAFNQAFLPETDFESGQFQVIDSEGKKPGLFPTGYANLSFNPNDGKYYYVNNEGSLTELPPGITVSSKVSATTTAKDPSISKINSGFLDASQASNQISGGIIGLDDIYASLDAPGAQSGPIGNLKKIAQNLMSIAEDAGLQFDPLYESMLEYTNQDNDALTPFVNQAKNQFETDIGFILQKRAQQGVESLTEDEAKLLASQDVMKKFLDGKAFVGKDEQGNLQIMPLEESYVDEALFQNAIKVNALIYAVARARKPTGRLNVDDIKNASNDINIWGMGERTLKASLRAIRDELVTAGADKVKEMIISDPDSAIYEPYMNNFFVTPDAFNQYKQQYIDARQQSEDGLVNVTTLPEIQDRAAYISGGNDNFLVPGGGDLPASGNDNTQSMNKFLEIYGGGTP